MRNMSFMLTVGPIRARQKIVTRRLGWLGLKPGDQIRAVEKAMGLKKGEKVTELAILKVVDVRRERLARMSEDVDYGFAECRKEGFGDHPRLSWPSSFVEFFCATHQACTPETVVTRIEFEYVEAG